MRRAYLIIVVIAFIFTSCVTINIYFPAAAVEKAADKIVEEVWGEEGKKPRKKEEGPGPQGLLKDAPRLVIGILAPAEAYAQGPDINISTPAIRAIKDSIKKRAGRIKPYLDRGNVGISKDGLLVIRSLEGLSLREKALLRRMIKAENEDREALYREIAKANDFPPERVDDIKRIFAKSWRKKAKKGWWIESEDGQWYRKK